MSIDALKSKPFWIVTALAGSTGVGLTAWFDASDPCKAQVLNYVSASEQVVSRLGVVSRVKIRDRLVVQDAVSVDDQFRPGYRSYTFLVAGSKSKAVVSVKTKLQSCSPTIASIDND